MPDDPTTEEQQVSEDRRRELTALLVLLIANTGDQMAVYAEQVADGTLSAQEFGDQALGYLSSAHAEAAHRGRQLAGVTEPYGVADVAYGSAAAADQGEYLAGFVSDLQAGRYNVAEEAASGGAEAVGAGEAAGAAVAAEGAAAELVAGEGGTGILRIVLDLEPIERRARMYAGALLGTGNSAWADAQPAGTLFHWRLDRNENHCGDCPSLAAGSPYTAETLPCHPGDGGTACLENCRCWLETEGGQLSFQLD